MISRIVSGNAANGSLSYTSGYKIGDIIVLCAENTSGSTIPTTPSGYTSVTSSQNTTSGFSMGVFYKVVGSSTETAPTLSNATSLTYTIYRGVNNSQPFVGAGGQSGSTSTISYSGIASYQQGGSSVVLTFAAVKGTTGNAGSVPPNTSRVSTEYKSGSDNNVMFETFGVMSSYAFNSKTLAATLPWLTKTMEMQADPYLGSAGGVFLKHILTAGSSTDASSYNTASVDITGNRLALLWVYSIASAAPNQPTVSGAGGTWVNIGTSLDSDGLRRITLFRSKALFTTGALTISFAGQTQTGCNWSLSEYDFVSTNGANGSAAVVQVASYNTTLNATSATATLNAFSNPTNATVGGFGIPLNSANTPMPGSTFLQNGQVNQSNPNQAIISESLGFSSTSVSATAGGSVPWVAVVAEIGFQAAPSAPTLSTPADAATSVSVTPSLGFSTTDTQGEDLTYQVQVDPANTFNSSSSFATPILRKAYSLYPGNQPSGIQVVAGDLIIVGCTYNNSLQSTSCSDNASGGSNTYSQVGTGIDNSATGATSDKAAGQVFYAIAKATETLTITVTSQADIGVIVHLVSGADQNIATVLDTYAAASISAASTSLTSSSISTAQSNEYLFAMWFQESLPGTVADNSSGFSLRIAQVGHVVHTLDRTAPTATSYTSAVTTSDTLIHNYQYIFIAFKTSHAPTIDAFSQSGSHDSAYFSNTTTPADTDPFNSGNSIQFAVPVAEQLSGSSTYYWRVRASDPNGSALPSLWSSTRSFTTIGPSAPTNLFFY